MRLTLGILAQAPDGGAPAGKAVTGPDAVPANLVNTACASCHLLDRVNSRKADRNTWATTVSRMKGMGAVLTDEQVPLVAEYLTRVAGTLTVAATDGGAKGGGKGVARAPRKVVPKTSRCSREPICRPPCSPSCRRWAFWIRERAATATWMIGPPTQSPRR